MKHLLPLGLGLALLAATPAFAQEHGAELKDVHWSFEGPFGKFDKGQLQRGFQVYKEVCAACHSLNRVSFAALAEEGGPGFTEPQAKALATAALIPAEPNDAGETYNEKGERITRPGILADRLPSPYANANAARTANNGAVPPDLSIITKARKGGPAYVYSLLTSFHHTPPAGFNLVEGKYYNPVFPGGNISMPPPLADNSVTFADGTKATIDQEAKDVVAFLEWAAEPKMEERKHLGLGVMIFLLALSGLLFLSYRKLWHGEH